MEGVDHLTDGDGDWVACGESDDDSAEWMTALLALESENWPQPILTFRSLFYKLYGLPSG